MQVECVVCGKKFFTDYKNCVACSAECKKNYHKMYGFTLNRVKLNTRNSGKKYTNSKEKLLAIKEKYKNGISNEMLLKRAKKSGADFKYKSRYREMCSLVQSKKNDRE